MPDMTRPLLSISMIVKNEEKNLERCLSSLAPLREAIPCEIVIADTGSTDRTKEIAAGYADTLFDFEWVNDFSKARNAALDRCAGVWAMILDADEHIDPDVHALTEFLQSPEAETFSLGMVNTRSFLAASDRSKCSDFMGVRLVRLATGLRYHGAVHEAMQTTDGSAPPIKQLPDMLVYHEGYNNDDPAHMAAKMARNMELLDREAKLNPYSMRRMVQCIESAPTHAEKMKYIRRGMRILQRGKNKEPLWEPLLYRHAIVEAKAEKDYDLMAEYIQTAEEQYGTSIFIRVDAEGAALMGYYESGRYEEAIAHGAKWEAGLKAYDTGDFDQMESGMDLLIYTIPGTRAILYSMMLDCYCRLNRLEEAAATLEKIDIQHLQGGNWDVFVNTILDRELPVEVASAQLQRVWNFLSQDGKQDSFSWDRRKVYLMDRLNQRFPSAMPEGEGSNIQRSIARMNCEPGRSARILLSQDPAEASRELAQIENWSEVLFAVYAHVIRLHLPLPASFFQCGSEALSDVAALLPGYDTDFVQTVLYAAADNALDNAVKLTWALDLTMAALRKETWNDAEKGEALCGQFGTLAQQYLSMVYEASMLDEENIMALPGMHRFGWYYLKAQQALEAGDEVGYVRSLREGLKTAPAMKRMVDFLSKRIAPPAPAKPAVSQELLDMAAAFSEKIEALRQTNPEAVEALLQSPAYRKLADHMPPNVSI